MTENTEIFTIIDPKGGEFEVPEWLRDRLIGAELSLSDTTERLESMTKDRDAWRERYETRTEELRALQERRRQANERKARRIARRFLAQ